MNTNKNRKIVLDTETTGLNFAINDRIVEIAAIELFDDLTLGQEFHYYVNPEREIPEESIKIHGISNEKVKNSPIFKDISAEFQNFIGDSIIIAHNAEFDRGFINVELGKLDLNILPKNRFIDSLALAKELFKGEKVSLDHLCIKFNIDKAARNEFHGALIDVKLLAKVYYELTVFKEPLQNNFLIEQNLNNLNSNQEIKFKTQKFNYRDFTINDEDMEAHHKFLLEKIKNPLWKN